MGRPPGALSGGARRRYAQDWELRDPRFEELDSEDEDGEGVILDPGSYRARDARARGFVSDELYFDGYDVAQDNRLSRRGMYDAYGDEFDACQLGYRDQEGMAYQAAVREKEEELIQSAMERIARARSKGKTNVNLSEEEMEALERRKGQQPEPLNPPLASPPATPAKPAAKGKVGSRSNSSSNLASKARKRNSGLFGSSPSPARSNSKAKVNRKDASDRALTYPTAQVPAGMMVTGPNGVPVYAPIYHSSPSPELSRSRPGSNAPSRSGSKHRRQEPTAPDRTETYPPYPSRYYLPPAGGRPESSGSNRSLPDDIDWYPPGPRHRSTSSVQYSGYPSDYEGPTPLPAAQGRRNFSGPADSRYSNLRHATPSSAYSSRPPPARSSRSDPAIIGRERSGLSREIGGDSSSSTSRSSSSSSSDDEQGVQVEIHPEGPGVHDYSVTRALMPAPAPASGNEGRKRRSGRR